jgi:hypothetical protein
MFKFFKRRVVETANPLQEKAAAWVVAKLLCLQNNWALHLDRCVNRLSARSKKIGLMVFVGLSVMTCVSILIETFTGPHQASSLKIGKISIRKYASATSEIRPTSPVSEQQYKRVIAFRYYMDSLSVFGRKAYDSINHFRPGLLDSALTLEKLYHNQNK